MGKLERTRSPQECEPSIGCMEPKEKERGWSYMCQVSVPKFTNQRSDSTCQRGARAQRDMSCYTTGAPPTIRKPIGEGE